MWLDGPDPRGPVHFGDWVSSTDYGFTGGRVVMDLGPDMVRVQLDRSELTAMRHLIWPASEEEISAAKKRLARIEKERAAPHALRLPAQTGQVSPGRRARPTRPGRGTRTHQESARGRSPSR